MPTHATWRLLITPPKPGALNMAVDQALADLYPDQREPTLRLYGWNPPCVSIGYGQRIARDVDLDACAARGIDVVRRPTGGRAILHDQEVTYALVAAVDDPHIAGAGVVQSYRAISEALCLGLQQLGVTTELAPRPAASAKSAACFDLPSDYEITVGGRKLVGSAQARRHGVLLQHGSLLLHADPSAIAAVLRLPDELGAEQLAGRLIALDEVLGAQPALDTVAQAIVHGFETSWGIKLVPSDLTAAEQERVAQLAEERFGNWAWTGRR
jgi:lipoyl(octanoyl) transferase